MLNKKKFSVDRLIDDCCSHAMQRGKHEFVIAGVKGLQIMADEHRIEQVINNFITNAVKYAPNSREIFLTTENLGDWVKLSLRDTGPGIPQEKLAHVFDRYFRADEAGYRYQAWD